MKMLRRSSLSDTPGAAFHTEPGPALLKDTFFEWIQKERMFLAALSEATHLRPHVLIDTCPSAAMHICLKKLYLQVGNLLFPLVASYSSGLFVDRGPVIVPWL